MDRTLWFLVETAGSLLAGVCLLRALAWRARLSPHDPLHRFAIAATDWLVKPLRTRLPPAGPVDVASLVGVAGAALATALAWSALFGGGLAMVVPLALAWGLKWAVYLVSGLVLLQAILSWVNPHAPVAPGVERLTQPFVAPLRRLIPTVGGVDLSPLVLLLAAQVVLALIEAALAAFMMAG